MWELVLTTLTLPYTVHNDANVREAMNAIHPIFPKTTISLAKHVRLKKDIYAALQRYLFEILNEYRRLDADFYHSIATNRII